MITRICVRSFSTRRKLVVVVAAFVRVSVLSAGGTMSRCLHMYWFPMNRKHSGQICPHFRAQSRRSAWFQREVSVKFAGEHLVPSKGPVHVIAPSPLSVFFHPTGQVVRHAGSSVK